jgi:replicative DNA helicase
MQVEECLIGACLSVGYGLSAAIEEGVTEADFASDGHRQAWRAMIEASGTLGEGEHLDAVLITKTNGSLRALGGASYLHALAAACPLASNVRQYAREVMDASLKRKLRGMMLELQDSEMDGKELLEEIQTRTFALERNPRETRTMSEAFQQVWHEVEHPTEATCSYPWREINYATRGLRPGWLTYLAGESSQGKTAAALEVADHVLSEGKSVLFISLEMTAFELAVRIAQREGFDTRVLYGRKTASDRDWQTLTKEIARPKWQRMRVEQGIDNVGQIGAVIRRVKPDLVILDYIQLLDIGRDSRVEGTTKNSRALKMLARKHAIPIVALSQLSRAGKEDRGRLPGLWRLRDSGALEQDADAVVFVWRKRSEDGEGMLPEGAFIVAKARMGNLCKVDFLFDGDRQTFRLVTTRFEQRDIP